MWCYTYIIKISLILFPPASRELLSLVNEKAVKNSRLILTKLFDKFVHHFKAKIPTSLRGHPFAFSAVRFTKDAVSTRSSLAVWLSATSQSYLWVSLKHSIHSPPCRWLKNLKRQARVPGCAIGYWTCDQQTPDVFFFPQFSPAWCWTFPFGSPITVITDI